MVWYDNCYYMVKLHNAESLHVFTEDYQDESKL